MPELPEVEVVKRELEKIVQVHSKIERIELLRADLREPMPSLKELSKFEGAKFERLERRAKYILLFTDKGNLYSHLGMTGTWRFAKAPKINLKKSINNILQPHDHIVIYLQSEGILIYNDPRRFGLFGIFNEQVKKIKMNHLGPEPLSENFTTDYFWQACRKKQQRIKSAIMDQSLVVGVGNIYASEALFGAGISPLRQASRVTRQECETLISSIVEVLHKAILAGGSSISDFSGADGRSGYFQNHFQVYDRAGLACEKCGNLIKKRNISGRSSFYCTHCQS